MVNHSVVLILGNQLFSEQFFKKELSPAHLEKKPFIFMREDAELCTHFKYHQHKIVFFLAAMRKYAQSLSELNYKVHYEKLETNLALKKEPQTFDQAFLKFIQTNKINFVYLFEIEDKFFEKRIYELLNQNQIAYKTIISPMFVCSREEFKKYLSEVKKPFMKKFYERQRKLFNVLIDQNQLPVGGQWSFDDENRLPLPKDYVEKPIKKYQLDKIDKDVIKIVKENFADHPGNAEQIWLPTTRDEAKEWLELFLKERLTQFGPYEDALSNKFDIINHSVLTPFLNCGLLTPAEVINQSLRFAKNNKIPLNSLEGFIRQILGWREFIRGIYQNYSELQESKNFFNHQRKLKPCWYDGTTGIAPLDDVIKKTIRLGYAHHIERLMVVGSLMLLLEVSPTEAYKWFMEMFIDSSDWVMGPNVYGMALFSDGGLFATKPYFCGSNYYKKMGPYKKGDWQQGVDGLYWSFIEKNQAFLAKNHRLSMMVKTVQKMDPEKKTELFSSAKILKEKLTY